MLKRPLAVTIVAGVYILAGGVGFVYHATEFTSRPSAEFVWIEVLRLLAILCGVYLLRGAAWARWLALAWMGYHVVLSAFHSAAELAVHAVFFITIAYFLFRLNSTQYFRAGT